MKNKYQHYSEKDKSFLFEQLLKLRDNGFSEGLFKEEELTKINIIEKHGFLTKQEINKINSISEQSFRFLKLINIEKRVIDSKIEENKKIKSIFNNEGFILTIQLESLKKYKRLYSTDLSIIDTFINKLFKLPPCENAKTLFFDNKGSLKTKNEVKKEINLLSEKLKKLKYSKLDHYKSSIQLTNTIKKISQYNCINQIEELTYLGEIYKKNICEIEEKEQKIYNLNCSRESIISKIPKIDYQRYSYEHEVMLIFYGTGGKNKLNRYTEIRQEVQLLKESYTKDNIPFYINNHNKLINKTTTC